MCEFVFVYLYLCICICVLTCVYLYVFICGCVFVAGCLYLQLCIWSTGCSPACVIDEAVCGVEDNTRAGTQPPFLKFHAIRSQNSWCAPISHLTFGMDNRSTPLPKARKMNKLPCIIELFDQAALVTGQALHNHAFWLKSMQIDMKQTNAQFSLMGWLSINRILTHWESVWSKPMHSFCFWKVYQHISS